MFLTIKFLVLAALFVGTGGAVFTDWGRRHPVLVTLAAFVAVLASAYLFRDIYEDFKREVRQELSRASSSPSSTVAVEERPLTNNGPEKAQTDVASNAVEERKRREAVVRKEIETEELKSAMAAAKAEELRQEAETKRVLQETDQFVGEWALKYTCLVPGSSPSVRKEKLTIARASPTTVTATSIDEWNDMTDLGNGRVSGDRIVFNWKQRVSNTIGRDGIYDYTLNGRLTRPTTMTGNFKLWTGNCGFVAQKN